MYDVYKRILCLGMCAVGLGVSALQAEDAEAVTKTWTVTLDDGVTNNAPVTLSDGNYTLRGWIRPPVLPGRLGLRRTSGEAFG